MHQPISFEEEIANDIERMQKVIDIANYSTKEHLTSNARLLAQNTLLINAVQTLDYQTFSSFSKQLLNDVHTDFITITDNSGIVIWRGHSQKRGDNILNQETVVKALNSPFICPCFWN